ncbi:MAG: GAP family protein [Solirubrobacterales bacterium]|nr:GAP family protein [Solirubrobacterales bacterium]MBV9715306.1 GAP family protein [Solirubrobacterales bacterium]
MIRLIGIVISIGLADSLNPSTIAPALYLATGESAAERVAQFTLGVFSVYLVGGVAIALGPGRLLFSLIPHPHHQVGHMIEIAAGLVMIGGASLLWRHRANLAERDPPRPNERGRSSALLGATITAVELPTAFPYFAAIAAIVGADPDPARAVGLIVLFNFCFVLPLLGIVATLMFAGDRAAPMLRAGRDFLQRRWPVLLAGLALAAGVFVVFLGATGFAANAHGHLGRFVRRLRRAVRP